MHNISDVNALISLFIFILLIYFVPLLIDLIVLLALTVKTILNDEPISKCSEKYIYPISMLEFSKRLIWSFLPILNVFLVIDFVSKFRFYKRVGCNITNISAKEPLINSLEEK